MCYFAVFFFSLLFFFFCFCFLCLFGLILFCFVLFLFVSKQFRNIIMNMKLYSIQFAMKRNQTDFSVLNRMSFYK